MTPIRNRVIRIISLAALALALDTSAAFAQSQVRVVRESAIIWRSDTSIRIVATTARIGTVLDVVGREGEWYLVVIPMNLGGRGESGLIAVSQVEVIAGGAAPLPTRPSAPATSRPPQRAPDVQERPTTARRTADRRQIEVLGFGNVGYGPWMARNTFNAVLSTSSAPMFGGGGQVNGRNWFVQGSAEWFQKTGQRVFVNNGEVFNLGIADTVRVIPIAATVGYRHRARAIAPYVGAGVGMYLFKETSDFADPSENLSERFTSYHAMGGVEFLTGRSVRAAVEVQYTTVPDALGASGASAAFNEHNLGGVQVRVKILAGR